MFYNHVGTTPAYWHKPHVFPGDSLINPASPHPVPHEFLIFHEPSAAAPTKRTAWLIPDPQLPKTPPLYDPQLEASTVTEIGSWLIPFANPLHPGKLPCPEILKLPPFLPQAWSLPTYGYSDCEAIPFAATYFRALDGHPPLHPWFPCGLVQSTNCCSERSTLPLPVTKAHDYKTPVAEKAQHDPHPPWFLTLETFPWVVQSTAPIILYSLSPWGYPTIGIGVKNLLTN